MLLRWLVGEKLREKHVGVNLSSTAPSALHSPPPTRLLSVTQWSHSIHRNLCSPPAGNAAVVKPSELSEYSALLLRALLPRYLDKVWTPAAIVIVGGIMCRAAVTSEASYQHSTVHHSCVRPGGCCVQGLPPSQGLRALTSSRPCQDMLHIFMSHPV